MVKRVGEYSDMLKAEVGGCLLKLYYLFRNLDGYEMLDLLRLLSAAIPNDVIVMVQTTTNPSVFHLCQFRIRSSKHYTPLQNAYFQ